ncbi:MAG: hypothetical protein AAGA30_09535 [Planctomycetota bacterium]
MLNEFSTLAVYRNAALLSFLGLLIPANTEAQLFEITITGEVEFNQISTGILGNVDPGGFVGINFVVDSEVFFDSPNFPTRGYPIQSFLMDFGGSNQIELQVAFPETQTPYFVIRNDDPAVDGFFISTNVDFPVGVPLNQTGQFSQFINNFSATYLGDTLNSFDLQDANGIYDFDGLTVFNWTMDDGPFNASGFIFDEMLITDFGTTFCSNPLADTNLDFEVNLLDVGPFIDLLASGDYQCEADTNLDGSVNLLDVDIFVNILAGN